MRVTDLATALGGDRLTLIDAGGQAPEVRGVCVYDPGAADMAAGRLVLMVGVDGTEETLAGMRAAAANGCAGVVVDGPPGPAALAAYREAARSRRIAVLHRGADAGWLALADAVRDRLRAGGPAGSGGTAGSGSTAGSVAGADGDGLLGSVAPGDLPGLAEVLGRMLGGPVIIEDANFQVLAYSTWPGSVDHGRDTAILGGRIPDEWLKHLEKVGAIDTLLTSEQVIDVENGPFQARRRLLRALRVDDRPIGIMWVAEGSEPLPGDVAERMDVAARVAAPHLLRHQEETFGHRAAQRKVLRALMETGELSRSTAEDFGLLPANSYVVIGLRRAADHALNHAVRNRLVESVDLYCQSYRWRAATTAVGHTIYCLLAFDTDRVPGDVTALAHGLADNARRTMQSPMHVAVSERRSWLATAPELRDQVDGVLGVLGGPAHDTHAVVRFPDAVPQILLDRVGTMLRAHPYSAYHKLEVLHRHDEQHGSEHIRTLRALLGAFGNIRVASERLGLHPTTLRYRVRRLTELSGVDLDNRDERLFCELMLRE